jgi:hypothetical protein
MSRRIELGDVYRGHHPDRWKVIRRSEDNLDKGALTVMLTLRVVGSRRERQFPEPDLQELVDTGWVRLLPPDEGSGNTLLEILEPGDS